LNDGDMLVNTGYGRVVQSHFCSQTVTTIIRMWVVLATGSMGCIDVVVSTVSGSIRYSIVTSYLDYTPLLKKLKLD